MHPTLWLLLIWCVLTLLCVGVNLGTLSFMCLVVEIVILLFWAWKIRTAYKAAEKEEQRESSGAIIAGPDASRVGGVGGDSDLRPIDQE